MIETSRLLLRPFSDTDLAALSEYYQLEEVAKYLYWDAMDQNGVSESLQRKIGQTTLEEDGDVLSLAVWSLESKSLIGDVSLFLRSVDHKQGEVGFVFNPVFGGRGYATEAAGALIAYGFKEVEFHRIFGRCDPRNAASWKLMERLGMRREAHFVHNEMFKGEWGDEYHYAVLRDEFVLQT